MALKVAGTEVVDNSRGLKNITSVDTTTAAAITAAGVGGGGTYDFVASGAVGSGDVVVLNANGTVSVAGNTYTPITPPTAGSKANFTATNIGNDVGEVAVTYDSTNQKIVISYRDTSNSSYGTAVVGTVSGSSITFGTPAVFQSAYSAHQSATFDSNSGKVVIAYKDASANRGKGVVGTVSGTSISFGSSTIFDNSYTDARDTACTFDSTNNKVVIVYRSVGNSNKGHAVVGTVSGTSISFGTPVVFYNTTTTTLYPACCFDSSNSKVVITFGNNLSYFSAVVGTVSGTSISFGSTNTESPTQTTKNAVVYDSNANKVVAAYHSFGDYPKARVCTISGTSVSFASASNITTATTNIASLTAVFDANSNTFGVSYKDGTSSTNYPTFVRGEVSGTSLSFASPLAYGSVITYNPRISFDIANNAYVGAFQDSTNSVGSAVVVTSSTATSTADNWLGISTEAISDTATGTITIPGGVNEQQTGLTTGSIYYVADDGSLTTSTAGGRKIGKAIATTKLLITEGNA